MAIDVKIILTNMNVSSDNYQACVAILADCGFKTVTIVDREQAVKLGKGHVNPANGFVLYFNGEDEIIRTWDQLVKYIDKRGLTPI